MVRQALTGDWIEGNCALADGGSLFYRVRHRNTFEQPRLALIHSLGLDCSLWTAVVDHLPETMPILVYDCRGHGRSRTAAANFTIDQFAGDLAGMMDHVGWAHAAIAGCSMGGCVALAFAQRFSRRLSALGLVDTTDWYGPDGASTWNGRADHALQQGMAAVAASQAGRWFSESFRGSSPAVVHAALEQLCQADRAGYAAACRMLGATDLRSALPRIDAPTAVLVGEHDVATPPPLAQGLAQRIPHARLQVVAGAGHLSPLEQPGAIAAALSRLVSAAARLPTA